MRTTEQDVRRPGGTSTGPLPDRRAPRPLDGPDAWPSIGHRLRHVAEAGPDALAVRSDGEEYRYGELWATAHRWARALTATLDTEPPDRPVAFAMEPRARSVVALVAGILAGRPVVPVDPTLPAARAERIVAAAGALLVDAGDLDAADVAGGDLPEAGPRDPAVIFYTSGSTGTPKGVVHAHASWLNQAYAARLALDLTPADRNAMVLPLSFGAGLDVVFMSLLLGSSLHVRDPRVTGVAGLAGWLAEEGVTGLHTTPSLLRAILDSLGEGDRLAGVRVVTTCGEAIHSSLVERLRRHVEPGTGYVGLSGASEIGSLAAFPLPDGVPVPPGLLPVGRPVANKTVTVVDDDGVPLGPGVTGHVVVTSRFIADGYHRDPERTAAVFRRNADGTGSYLGSDLGQWDADGVLHLKGRGDSAVKIGGYLVEPAEVEAALLDSPAVREAVVTVDPGSLAADGGVVRPRLVAHVVPAPAEKPVTPASVRRLLRERLPAWMVPGDVVLLPALPRNERGKVDRPALPAVPGKRHLAPATPTERLLAELWRSVLGVGEVAADDDFWALGADSLAVEELIAAVEQATGVAVTPAGLTGAPTLAELAAVVDGGARPDPAGRGLPATAVRLRAGAGGPAVFAFAGGGASALSLLPIATALGHDVPVHGFHASGYAARALPDQRLRDVVRRHLAVLRRLAPHGPYVLMGHSFGGLVALETAARLAASGEDVPLVVLLDTILPGAVAARARAADPAGAGPEPAPPAVPPRRERWRMHARLLGAGLVRYPREVRDAVFWEQSLRMVNRHRLTTWAGRTLVFTAPGNTDQPSWWDLVLTGPHEVVPVDGGHSAILRPPFSRPIVARLDEELARLQRPAPEGSTP